MQESGREATWLRRIRNRTSIDQRPAIVERRTRISDWELDTIIGRGQKQVLVSLRERKSHLIQLAMLPDREAQTLNKAIRVLRHGSGITAD